MLYKRISAGLIALLASSATGYTQTQTVTIPAQQLAAIQQQLKSLQQQVQTLQEKVQSNTQQAKSAPQPKLAEAKPIYLPKPSGFKPANLRISEKKPRKKSETGRVHVKDLNTTFQLGGYAKLDVIYDIEAASGESSNMPGLPLRGVDAAADDKKNLDMHMRQSRLSLGTKTETAKGPVETYFEGDFFGPTPLGSAGLSRASDVTLSSKNFRLRHFWGQFMGFRIGQDWTTFSDLNALGESVEFNGPSSGSVVRHQQIRYTHPFYEGFRLDLAIENPVTDYTDENGTRKDDGSSVGDGAQKVPDLVFRLRHTFDWGHLSLRGMWRELRIRHLSDPIIRKSTHGYGFAIGARFYPFGKKEKTCLFGQVKSGRAIGRYFFDLAGQSAHLDTPSGKFQAQKAHGLILGGAYYWLPNLRSNISYGLSTTDLAFIAPRDKNITKNMQQFRINAIYSPVSQVDIGLEFGHYLRRTTGGHKGIANRIQAGFKYKFGIEGKSLR